jgi:anti-anti-sigma regulatory factor
MVIIAYELSDKPAAVVVEFLIHAVTGFEHAAELTQQFSALVRPDFPDRYVLDFHKVTSFGSTTFGALFNFVLKVHKAGGQVVLCNMDEFVRFGADILHLGDYALITADRQSALDHLAANQPG